MCGADPHLHSEEFALLAEQCSHDELVPLPPAFKYNLVIYCVTCERFENNASDLSSVSV
jgi:hypothetical protein